MAYPDPALERTTDGSACRFATTDEIRAIAERHAGVDLRWFFDAYLRTAELPRLEHSLAGGVLRLRWVAPGGGAFPMPVPVRDGARELRVEMPDGAAEVRLEAPDDHEIDPRGRVLKAR
jgi:aminopeptidase N